MDRIIVDQRWRPPASEEEVSVGFEGRDQTTIAL